MLDTVGPELLVVNKSENSISLQADAIVIITPDLEKEASSELFPINFDGLSKVIKIKNNYMYSFHLLESESWKVDKVT